MSKHETSPLNEEPTFSTASLDVSDLLGIAKRGWAVIATGVVLGLACGLWLLATMPPTYKAGVRLVMERSVNNYLRSNRVSDGPSLADDSWSQTHIISSEEVVMPVIDKLKLTMDPEFGGATATAQTPDHHRNIISTIKKFAGVPRSLVGEIKEFAGLKAPEPAQKPPGDDVAYKFLVSRLNAYWEHGGAVMIVTFESKDPLKAASIANEIAESYINSTVDSKRKTTRLAVKAMGERLAELRSQAADAERKVIEYKLANKIISVDPKSAASGRVNSLSTHIASARIAMLDAQARLEAQQRENANGSKRFIPDNDLIIGLRQQYFHAETRAIDMESRVGKDHAASIQLRKRLKEISAAIAAERKRVEESYAVEYVLAKAKYEQLASSLNRAMNEESMNSTIAARVRELESAAETLRTLYNSTLQRVSEENKLDHRLLILPDARILARASVPTQTESSKKRLMVLAGSSVLGLLLGVGLAFLKHNPIGVYRTTEQVKRSLGLMALIMPKVKKRRSAHLGEYALDQPYSRFAESVRLLWSLINVAQRENNAKVICVVSAVANEGKTTIATNLANQVSMHATMRTLLIDADFHKQSLTQAVTPDAQNGLREALDHPERFSDFVVRKERSGVEVLPCPLPHRPPNAAQALGSAKMEDLLNRARASYDLVVIEAPPIAAVADFRLLASYCDGFVFVVEWGKTSQRLILETFGEIPNLWERVVCVVLNKADPAALQSIEHYKGRDYHSYFRDD
ncbi:AAA family ATPase, partial [Pseudorhodoplanes sp.]|uniref:AAA family ATPase n=1 Tax=Pseudorhodoplanes sp. TaxID=1934341 RepID=UPI003D122D24